MDQQSTFQREIENENEYICRINLIIVTRRMSANPKKRHCAARSLKRGKRLHK